MTSQEVVGADIVLWFLNPGGNHRTLMVCPTHSVEGRQMRVNSIILFMGVPSIEAEEAGASSLSE